MRYRGDIEGLRAVAVVPIVLFHAGVSSLSGGFVGVDIFFVISGFLITRILFEEIEQNRFSVLEFYKRRAVRILPALFVVLAIVLLVGWFLLLPPEFHDLGDSAAAAAGFASNLYFWRTADYFATAAEFKPLLHTWSLGVEEQFYIIYPALLLILRWMAPTRVRLAVGLLTAASFLFAGYLVWKSPSAAFYLLPSRAWELGLGALVALGAMPSIRSINARTTATIIGVALIGIGYFVIRPGMLFPAPWAAAPCIGAALILAYGQNTIAGKALSVPPLRFVGKLSYSLYLWHWPIVSFYRLEYGATLDRTETLCLTAAAFAMAVLSYYLVERPFLRGFRSAPMQRVLPVGMATLVAMVGAPFLMIAAGEQSAATRLGSRIAGIASYLDYRTQPRSSYQFRPGSCFRSERSGHLPFTPSECIALEDDRPNIVVLGDSHAAQYWRALQHRYPDANVLQATASGCRPTRAGAGAARCREVVDYVLGTGVNTGKVDTLVLAAQWTPEDVSLLQDTVREVRPKVRLLAVIGPTVEYDGDFPRLAVRALQRRDSSWTSRFYMTSRRELDQDLATTLADSGALYVSALDIECPQDACRQFAPDGAPMLWDSSHLTFSGATWVVGQMPNFLSGQSGREGNNLLHSQLPKHLLDLHSTRVDEASR